MKPTKSATKNTIKIEKEKPYFKEWLASKVDPELISLNVRYMSGNTPYEYLLYFLDNSDRTNNRQLRDKHLRNYSHIYGGGWWCSGVDLLNGYADSDWGCFKPDEPRTLQGKLVKYETPPGKSTEIFALKVPDKIYQKVSNYWEIPKTEDNFWEWTRTRPVPIFITEGAKKAGALLSAGFAAVALPGINNGLTKMEDEKGKEYDTLIPHLRPFANHSREIVLVFDQDSRFKTQKAVALATVKLGEIYQKVGCEVSVLCWNPSDGKGIDDFIANKGEAGLSKLYSARLSLAEFKEQRIRKVKKITTEAHFLDFCRENEIHERLRYNELTLEIELDGQVFDDFDYFKSYFSDIYSVDVSAVNFCNAINYFAKSRKYHPVRDYLESLADVPHVSLDNLATRYFGLNSDLDNTKIKRWLIGAVARVLSPQAVDFSAALILYGREQGMGKSRFFKTLGGDWHADDIDELRGRDNALKQHRNWILEVAEFDQITNKKDEAQLKSWVSIQTDTFREPFGRKAKAYRRRFAIAATVNTIEFLKDPTGSRRYWIIDTQDRPIDFERLATERDGIWAAAVAAYKAGERYWFDRSELRALQEANQKFEAFDDWQARIEGYCERHHIVTTADILRECFGVTLDTPNYRQQQTRATKILTKLRYDKFRQFSTTDEQGYPIRPVFWISSPLKQAIARGEIPVDSSLEVFQAFKISQDDDKDSDDFELPPENPPAVAPAVAETTAMYYSRAETLPTDTLSEPPAVVPVAFEEKQKTFNTVSETPPPDPGDRPALMACIKEETERIKSFNPKFDLPAFLKATYPGKRNAKQLSDGELLDVWRSLTTIQIAPKLPENWRELLTTNDHAQQKSKPTPN